METVGVHVGRPFHINPYLQISGMRKSGQANHDPPQSRRSASVQSELEDLFVQILMMARSMGFLKLATVTKVQANACRHKALSWKYANRLETQLQAEVEQLMPRRPRGLTLLPN